MLILFAALALILLALFCAIPLALALLVAVTMSGR